MRQKSPPSGPPAIIDTGIAPEFFVTNVPKIEEIAGSDCVRLYACVYRDHGAMVLQYTAIIPKHCLKAILASLEPVAADVTNVLMAFTPTTAPS